MHLRDLGVPVADRVGQRGGRTPATEQDQVGCGGLSPVAVVARQQDLIALRVDGVHPELAPGDRHRLRQPGGETTGHIFDDVGRQDVVEQLPPGGVGLRERHHRGLAAVERLHPGDQVIAGGVHRPGLPDHLAPQIPEVVRPDRRVVGPLRLGTDPVGHRERILTGDLRGLQQRGVQFPARPGRRAGVRYRPERARQYQRADRRVHRGLVRQQVRVEPGADRIDRHDDLRRPHRRRRRRLGGVGALRRRRRADRTTGEQGQRHGKRRQCRPTDGADASWSRRHALQGIHRSVARLGA
ncbi:Uncharacterised protein [Mycolicibacterium vanbaalenii]|uniref:Uncharacterized protein n=1 Tax=Mycolicibacterium vanbaalenii TaxID=110539 RepID=A0A5S9R6W0_MYCVN|nr:Uncharacterised protein [Mycolicibacterium vanbaalenii]